MVSLNDINEEVDNEYGPFVIDMTDTPGEDEIHLRNALRLSKNEREQLTQLNGRLKDAQGDANKVLDAAAELIELVAVGTSGKRLLEALADDPPKIIKVVSLYKEATQPGEASRSES